MRFCSSVIFAIVLTACTSATTGTGGSGSGSSGGGSNVALDSSSLCQRYVKECGGAGATLEQCELTFGVLRVSQACADALSTASCAELSASHPSFESTCFPACATANTYACNADGTITTCNEESRTYVADCAETCARVGSGAYSGTCGKMYQGQTADHDQCWCK